MSKAAGANPPRAAESGICASVVHKACRGFSYRGLYRGLAALPLRRLWDFVESPAEMPQIRLLRFPYLRRSLAYRDPFSVARHYPETPSICEGSVTGNHLLALLLDGAYSSFSQLFRNIRFREKWVTYCGVEQSGSSPGS